MLTLMIFRLYNREFLYLLNNYQLLKETNMYAIYSLVSLTISLSHIAFLYFMISFFLSFVSIHVYILYILPYERIYISVKCTLCI
jgi:hypothetical protein